MAYVRQNLDKTQAEFLIRHKTEAWIKKLVYLISEARALIPFILHGTICAEIVAPWDTHAPVSPDDLSEGLLLSACGGGYWGLRRQTQSLLPIPVLFLQSKEMTSFLLSFR